jgi:dihydroorotate dehydrogenase electron transfer subunit
MISQKINKFAKQLTSEIIGNKKVGPYHHMVFAVGEIASHAKPGNFVAISVGGDGSSMVSRRAFAIYRAVDKRCFRRNNRISGCSGMVQAVNG